MLKNQLSTLYVVATPIGNLMDMTLRAIEVLKSVSLIAAEDTRHSAKLLNHFAITTPTLSFHEHNEEERINKIIAMLMEGKSIALISDAGTPLISDPGYGLIKAARERGIPIAPIPGPCAAIAALSVAGLPTDKFLFMGFLPAKSESLKHTLQELIYEDKTIIFYVAPHRLLSTLQQMKDVFGETRIACIARELTKMYESIKTDTLLNLQDHFEKNVAEQCGEIVLLLAPSQSKTEKIPVIAEEVLTLLLEELPLKQAASLASKITGVRKNELYELALQKKKD